MASYNDLSYLPQAVASILGQTFTNFEFIIIDDGSTDGSDDFLCRLSDPRLRVIRNEINLGLTLSLNRGLQEARGHFIARMDADDIALSTRLQKQVVFLRAHPDIGICGSACIRINSTGKRLGIGRVPVDPMTIRWASLLKNPFIHPTVMLNRHILDQGQMAYDPSFRWAQDYELWIRFLKVTWGANLAEPLLLYRIHPNQVTSGYRTDQLANHRLVSVRALNDMFPSASLDDIAVDDLLSLFSGVRGGEAGELSSCVNVATLYLDLFDAFKRKQKLQQNERLLHSYVVRQVVLAVAQIPLPTGWHGLLLRLAHLNVFTLALCLLLLPGYRLYHRYLKLRAV